MSIILFLLAFCNIIILTDYLRINVVNFGGNGVGVLHLAISFVIFLCILCLHLMKGKIILKRYVFILLIFFFYFVVNCYRELDLAAVKEYTIGTSGGVFFSFMLGLNLSFSLFYLFDVFRTKSVLVFNYLILVLLIVLTTESVLIVIEALNNISDTLFQILTVGSDYQRPGAFVCFHMIMLSCIIISINYINRRVNHVFLKFLFFIYLFLYLINFFIIAAFSQLLGSNSALIVTIGVAIITFTFLLMSFVKKQQYDRIRKRFLKFELTLLKKGIFIASIIFLLGFSLILYLNIDINKTRIMNYGKSGGAPSSVTTRMKLLEENMFEHFYFNPIFGNMNVDTYTTGKGTYVHSFILSIFTHLGVAGFLLFSLLLYFVLWNILRYNFHNENVFKNSFLAFSYKYYLLVILLFILLIGTLSTFFTWIVFWFAIGFLINPFSEYKK
jgi:hypothetical protein